MMPTSSNVPWVGEKPFSSASTPTFSEPPFWGVAFEIPSGWVPVEPPDVDELEPELELELELPQAASTVPAAMPAPATALLARNERRSMRSVMIPLRTDSGGSGGHSDAVQRRTANSGVGRTPP
jgi:hypothetical protein